MKYNIGDEVYIKGRVMNIVTNTPYEEHPKLFYQIDIGEIGNVVVAENKVVDVTKLVKAGKVFEAKEYKKDHYK